MSNSYLNDDDVLFAEGNVGNHNPRSYKASEFIHEIYEWMTNRNQDYIQHCLGDGAECQCLQVKGSSWQKGKIRLRLEFIPDAPDSQPLDDLRTDTSS